MLFLKWKNGCSTMPGHFGIIIPLKESITGLEDALVRTFTLRSSCPRRPSGLNVILISPDWPGATGCAGNAGFVQPQPPLLTDMMTSGSSPVLVNR